MPRRIHSLGRLVERGWLTHRLPQRILACLRFANLDTCVSAAPAASREPPSAHMPSSRMRYSAAAVSAAGAAGTAPNSLTTSFAMLLMASLSGRDGRVSGRVSGFGMQGGVPSRTASHSPPKAPGRRARRPPSSRAHRPCASLHCRAPTPVTVTVAIAVAAAAAAVAIAAFTAVAAVTAVTSAAAAPFLIVFTVVVATRTKGED